MSTHSPGPVQGGETIVRMVVSPMFLAKKKREVKPNFFGHAFSYGLSTQRVEAATEEELASWVVDFIAEAPDKAWLGFVQSSCQSIRDILPAGSTTKSFCVYDAALNNNPAHAEIASSYRIPEADQVEFRAHLMKVFGDGQLLDRSELKEGRVWDQLPFELRSRAVPPHWQKPPTI